MSGCGYNGEFCVEEEYQALLAEYIDLRRALRAELGRWGIRSNPGWIQDDFIAAIRRLAKERETVKP